MFFSIKLQHVFECCLSAVTQPTIVLPLFIALSTIRCSKSAHKSAVQVCQVATVVMETTQLVLN